MEEKKISEWSEMSNTIDVVLFRKKYVLYKKKLYQSFLNLQLWSMRDENTFNNMLFKLIAKADRINKEKLLLGYPEQVVTYMMWFWRFTDKKNKDITDKEFFEYWLKRLGNRG